MLCFKTKLLTATLRYLRINKEDDDSTMSLAKEEDSMSSKKNHHTKRRRRFQDRSIPMPFHK